MTVITVIIGMNSDAFERVEMQYFDVTDMFEWAAIVTWIKIVNSSLKIFVIMKKCGSLLELHKCIDMFTTFIIWAQSI